jgi:hypothetical protein
MREQQLAKDVAEKLVAFQEIDFRQRDTLRYK